MCTATPKVVPVFHRLNRTEYQNTVNVLLGTNLPLRDDLPVDALVNGLDNNADTAVSATLLQKYLTSAQKAVEAALASATSKAKLVPCAIETDAACPRKVLEAFLPQAFRRPVAAAEVDQHLAYMTTCSASKTAGISCALQAALLSPNFLFRTELLGTGQAATCTAQAPLTSSPQAQLASYELASRLSYFLWSAPPDATLFDLAAKGMLNDPATLAAQVDRMLAPAASGKYVRPFLDSLPTQWLQLDAVASAVPSPKLFPTFDEPLRQAMQDESRLFFAEILQQNLSALELLRSNFTFANQRLAQHYGLPAVAGTAMQRVDTTGTARGGILTQGSFLLATSSSENTSIVQRAKWVLNNLLCETIPAPPPGAQDSVPPPDPGLGLTNRESLSIRTANAPCNGCHTVLNPIGFGLEIFDAIGAQRSTDKGKPIDASGALPGGAMFANTDELLNLLKNDERFPACLTHKILTYALGRSMTAACDAETIQTMAQEFKADGFHLKSHIVRIVQSDLFRSARRK
jgi:hypothetical protein